MSRLTEIQEEKDGAGLSQSPLKEQGRILVVWNGLGFIAVLRLESGLRDIVFCVYAIF